MATLRVTFNDFDAGVALRRSMRRNAARVRSSLRDAGRDAGREILVRGRANIKSAGRFGSRWTGGLRAHLENEDDDDLAVAISHDVPYFMVFQRGKVIKGHPLLWIPLSFAHDAQGKRARDFPGGLFRVDRKDRNKAPLLLSIKDKEPKYFGKESVTIPKKFKVIEICREVSRKMREFYRVRFASSG